METALPLRRHNDCVDVVALVLAAVLTVAVVGGEVLRPVDGQSQLSAFYAQLTPAVQQRLTLALVTTMVLALAAARCRRRHPLDTHHILPLLTPSAPATAASKFVHAAPSAARPRTGAASAARPSTGAPSAARVRTGLRSVVPERPRRARPANAATASLDGAASTRRPMPAGVETTENFRLATELSDKLAADSGRVTKKKVAIIGGGLSGLSAAKYLADAGHEPVVYEARDVLGGKTSAWQDEDGDWIETGLHIFFGAYPNMMRLLKELDIRDRLQWKEHKLIFAMQQLPGEFTSFDFIEGVPAPFNMALAILMNQKMLSFPEKLQTAPPLLPMLVEGQKFIDSQDELSVIDFMRKYGMPEKINEEVWIAMAKALDFIDPDKLSMGVVLTAMNRFLNETDGSQMAFLDGNQPDRLCKPMVDHVTARGGAVHLNSPVKEIVVDEGTGEIVHLLMADGSKVVADEYVSAMPVDVFKRFLPAKWSTMPFFVQTQELEGIPVINLQLWFDRKLNSVDHLTFSRSPLLSVYADMSVCVDEYADPDRSMISLVFAPCSPLAGSEVNWMGKTDEEIIDATMGELARLFPLEIANDAKWPATAAQGPRGQAKLRKFSVVKVPRSVYAAIPGRNKFRPSQRTPIANFTLAGDWTYQKYLGSMEGAIFAGKLAAEVIADKAAGRKPATCQVKEIPESTFAAAAAASPKNPPGVRATHNISYGGGQQMPRNQAEMLSEVLPADLAGVEEQDRPMSMA